jgi:hypothetical protein
MLCPAAADSSRGGKTNRPRLAHAELSPQVEYRINGPPVINQPLNMVVGRRHNPGPSPGQDLKSADEPHSKQP